MKAAYVVEPYKVEIRDAEKPLCTDGDVLIRVKNAGVCGSDLHLFRGTHAFRKPPAVLGHEVAGEVVEVGTRVKNIRVGDRVTVEPQIGCGCCQYCKDGMVNLCPNKTVPGTPKWFGTFSEYFTAPESVVYKLADQVSFHMGTMIEPLAVAVHAMAQFTVPERNSVVILGAGSIGLLCLEVARKMGFSTIICTDTAPFNRKIAQDMGAIVMDPLKEDVPEAVKKITGGGANAAVITAGASNIVDQAAASVQKKGEICLVAMITEKIPVYTYGLVFNEQRLFGSMTYSSPNFKKAADMINSGLDLNALVTQVMDISHTQEALEVLSEKKKDVVKVLIEF